MLRRALFLAILTPIAAADPRQEIYDLLGSMANALSEESPAQFLEAFDRSMKGYEELAVNVRALLQQVEVGSNIEIVDSAGDAGRRSVHVDWILHLRDKQNRASVVRREKTLLLRLEQQRRKWRIVSLEPLDFFSPPRVEH